MLLNPDARDWLHMARTYDQHRYSPLTQINQSNVGQLRLAWARGLPAMGSRLQGTPLVHNGIMYLTGPGDLVQAIDATTGDQFWQWVPEYEGGSARSKSLGIYEDMIFWNTYDGFVRALNAQTGELVWETPMTGRNGSRNSSGGVLVADGKVLMNGACTAFNPEDPDNTGREGCYIVALDVMTGEQAWKFYTAPADGEFGADTWPAHLIEERRNASTWGLPGSYDPELRLTYWGAADPKPYPQLTRYATEIGLHDGVPVASTAPTDLFSNSTMALEIDTGELAWYYQGLPGDSWDGDHNQERFIITAMFNPDPNYIKWINPNVETGVERKFVVNIAEGGGQFATDAETGQFLWARPFPYDVPDINMNYIDVETGRTYINFDKVFTKDGETVYECYHNTRMWAQTTYSDRTNSQYVYFHDQCLTMVSDATQARGYGLRDGGARIGTDPTKAFGNLAKIDMSTGEMRILYQSGAPSNGAMLSTAGGLVFNGDLLGRLRAFDDETGVVLWEQIVGSAITQSTITYVAGGKQYLMVFTGARGAGGNMSYRRQPWQEGFHPPNPVLQHYGVFAFALP